MDLPPRCPPVLTPGSQRRWSSPLPRPPPTLVDPLSRPALRSPHSSGVLDPTFPGEAAAEGGLAGSREHCLFCRRPTPRLPGLCCCPRPPALHTRESQPLSSPTRESHGHLRPKSSHPTNSPAFRVLLLRAQEWGVATCAAGVGGGGTDPGIVPGIFGDAGLAWGVCVRCPFCPKQDHRFPKAGAATHSVPLYLVPEFILSSFSSLSSFLGRHAGLRGFLQQIGAGVHRPSLPVSLSLRQLERPPGHLQGETARGTNSGEQETACGHFSGVTWALQREAQCGLRAQRVKRIHHGKPHQKEDQPGTPAGAQMVLLQRFKGKTILKGMQGCRAGGGGRWGWPTRAAEPSHTTSPVPHVLCPWNFSQGTGTPPGTDRNARRHSPWEEAAVSPEGKHTQTTGLGNPRAWTPGEPNTQDHAETRVQVFTALLCARPKLGTRPASAPHLETRRRGGPSAPRTLVSNPRGKLPVRTVTRMDRECVLPKLKPDSNQTRPLIPFRGHSGRGARLGTEKGVTGAGGWVGVHFRRTLGNFLG